MVLVGSVKENEFIKHIRNIPTNRYYTIQLNIKGTSNLQNKDASNLQVCPY